MNLPLLPQLPLEGGGPLISPNVAIGGPTWPRGRLQTARGSILSSRATILGPFPTILADLGSCPPADTLTPCHFIFSVFQQLATGLCPLEPHRDSGLGGGIGSKSYPTVVEIRRFRFVWPRTCV